ncbi:hypothetical protein BD410DRAFT_781668 [Rickenella mellea]|uniref:Uncharacterized protein n=1 Tax=Rickenella mellea TaxID=50990 RepID=A0A4Y7QJE8_9AGAM|nr:hypothetical protein BD410DRAFT_781668 [Rickenella mellea]
MTKAAVLVVCGVASYHAHHALGLEFSELDALMSAILFSVAISDITLLRIHSALPVTSVHRNSSGGLVNIPSRSGRSKSVSILYAFLSAAICIARLSQNIASHLLEHCTYVCTRNHSF